MNRAAAAVLVTAVAALCPAPAPAHPARAGQLASDLAEAVALGLSRDEARRAAFHDRYVQRLGGPLVQSIEVVTEFRRAVLLAEERARQGESAWAVERAAAALDGFRGRLDLVLHLRFDPLNAYRAMPHVNVVIYRREDAAPAVQVTGLVATPENFAGPVPPGTPILAATVTVPLMPSDLALPKAFLVGLFLDGREVQRIPVDLTGLR